MRDRTNHRRRLFTRWHGIESGGRHFSTNGTRWYASRYSYDTGKFIKHHLPEDKICSIEHHFPVAGPQTQGQDTQQRDQVVWPRRERREATALERGCNGIVFFFSGGSFGPWEARCLCFVFLVCVCLSICSLFIALAGDHFSSELKNMRGDSIFLHINLSKIVTTVSGSMYHMPWE